MGDQGCGSFFIYFQKVSSLLFFRDFSLLFFVHVLQMATLVVGGLIVGGAAAAGSAGIAAAVYKRKKWKEVKNATIIGAELASMRSVFFDEDEMLILVDLCCNSLESSIEAMTAFTSRDIPEFDEKEVEKMIKQFEGDKQSRKKMEKMFSRKQENPIHAAAILDRFFVCIPWSLFEEAVCEDFIKAEG